jgi:DNA-binding XRE family transcriptional regulator
MLHYCYVVIMLLVMGRKPKDQEKRVLNRIEELRLAKGVSRQDLADAVGVHYQTVGYIERGEYSPSLVLAFQIAKELQTPVEEVFSLEEEEN